MKLSAIHVNPKNPRLIKDERFKKLCKSIQDFPKMMALRPIIIDSGGMILGGNMRFKALKELGYKEVPDEWVKRAEELTEAEKEEFIAKDNVPFGEWDWDILKEWDKDKLIEWGLDIPTWDLGHEANNMTESNINVNEEFDPYGVSKGQQRVVFIFNNKDDAKSYLRTINVEFKKMNMAWQVDMSTQSI